MWEPRRTISSVIWPSCYTSVIHWTTSSIDFNCKFWNLIQGMIIFRTGKFWKRKTIHDLVGLHKFHQYSMATSPCMFSPSKLCNRVPMFTGIDSRGKLLWDVTPIRSLQLKTYGYNLSAVRHSRTCHLHWIWRIKGRSLFEGVLGDRWLEESSET